MKKLSFILFLILIPALLFSQSKTTQPSDSFQLSRNQARLTLVKSIVLPGWGEHSLGYHTRGFALQGSELLCWAAYAAFTFIGEARKKDMKAFAAEHAGVEPGDKNKEYFADISKYDNIYQYNEAMYRNRSISLVYSNADKYYWDWDNEDNRKDFDNIRFDSGVYLRNATLATTALIINRLVSVIDIMSLTGGKIKESNSRVRASFQPGLISQKLSISIDM